MDRELLNALQNIGEQLDILASILAKKNETTSDIANVLINGNFGEELKAISAEVKSIKSDTQQILKNQQTILSISKEKEKEKFGIFDDSGTQESNIKKGTTVIIAIAAAVLAIGFAFKLVGDVNVASVLSLTVAIGIIALSFEQLTESKLNIENVLLASGLMVTMSLGILLSSFILNNVSSVSEEKLLTSIGIAVAFSMISLSIGKLLTGLKDVKSSDVIPLSIGMMFIFPALSVGIVLSSYVLQYISPIGLSQIFSAILVSGLFVVLSYSIKNIVNGLDGINPDTAFIAAITIPILFTALTFAIAASSYALSLVQDITFKQFIIALGISILFVGLSYAIKPIISATKGIDFKDIITIPLLFTTMSMAIAFSSKFLKETEIIDFVDILKIVALGVGLAIVTAAMSLSVKLLSNIGIEKVVEGSAAIVIIAGAIMLSSKLLSMGDYSEAPDLSWVLGVGLSLVIFGGLIAIYNKLNITVGQILKGSIAIVTIAGAIMLSSKLLSMGDYSKSPDIGWSLGVGTSLVAFGLSAAALGLLVAGPQALVFAAGLVAILGVAGTIVGVSKILKEGDYNLPNMLDWAKSTALLYATFAPIMVILGGISLASGVLSVFGVNPWENAKKMMLSIADTIVDVSFRLSKGTYTGGPTKEWSEGVGKAIGAFSPVYAMLVANKVASIFSKGDIGPNEFNKAINTVADGIIEVSQKFVGTTFSGGPTKEWSEGVGTAIGAFSPVYNMLLANKVASWFGSPDIGPEQFNSAIKLVSEGIIETAKIFAKNTTPFDEGNYPSESWGKGVGAALGAFSPIFEMLMEKSGFWKSGKDVIKDMVFGVIAISSSIVSTAKLFSNDVNWESYPNSEWVENVTKVISKYISLIKKVEESDINYSIGTRIATRLVTFAKIINSGKSFFNNNINPDFVQNLSKNIIDYKNLSNELGSTSSFSDLFEKDPVVKVAKSMGILAKSYDKLASSLVNLNTSMKLLNVDNLKSLVVLTKTMTDPSIKIESVMATNELGGMASVSIPTQTISSNNIDINNNKNLEEKLDRMIQILSIIQSNTISLDQTTQLMSEERIKNDDII